jgi:plastocyanin
MRSRKNPTRLKLAAVAVVVGVVAAACSSIGAVEPNESGEVIFTLTDNTISPAVVRVKPGQTVRFVIENAGAHVHEFMIGRDPIRGENYLTERVWTPWGEDFFEGVDVMVSGDGMAMGFSGMGGMDMGDDAGGDMTSTTMDMTSTTMDMTSTTMDMETDGAQEEEGHAEDEGGMVLLEPGTPGSSEAGQFSIMEFTVPDDATGTWEIGCFQEAGQHYEDGMRATLIVEA